MKSTGLFFFISGFCLLFVVNSTQAQNPLIHKQFTADPTARVFENKIYVYPSHDILWSDVGGRENWFCMQDYHVYSSENLTDWTDHGVIVSQEKVPWVDSTTFSMWAPDCIYRNNKYYFYFPAIANAELVGKGMRIGVATSDKPYGPFVPEPRPIEGLMGIDPNILIDKDGQAYIYWAGMRRLNGAKLKDNMLELASEPVELKEIPNKMKEGPFVFERNDIYYLTFPLVEDSTEELAYAMGDNPLGPFEFTGVIMDQSPVGCWTNHQSIVEYNGQWYLFYHHNDLSPDFDKNRSIRADSLFFNEDGTIQKVIPTLRGIGITDATRNIQIDRYSAIGEGASINFLDTDNKPDGWKTILDKKGAWIRYNSVDFGNKNLKSVNVRALSESGGTIEVRLNKLDGPLVASVEIPKNINWEVVNSDLEEIPSGKQNLVVVLKGSPKVEIDWVRFE